MVEKEKKRNGKENNAKASQDWRQADEIISDGITHKKWGWIADRKTERCRKTESWICALNSNLVAF